jgi:hypothetical protein
VLPRSTACRISSQIADVLPVPPDALEPRGHLELKHGFDVRLDETVAQVRVAFGG